MTVGTLVTVVTVTDHCDIVSSSQTLAARFGLRETNCDSGDNHDSGESSDDCDSSDSSCYNCR